jgi:low affinity Fe/Cu permease
MSPVNEWFSWFARYTAWAVGTPWAFIASLLVVGVWAATGPFFGWSDTHQLIINTATTIVTFWMVFVIQHTQNSDTAQIKAMLRELVEDLSEVDEVKAAERAAEEEKP